MTQSAISTYPSVPCQPSQPCRADRFRRAVRRLLLFEIGLPCAPCVPCVLGPGLCFLTSETVRRPTVLHASHLTFAALRTRSSSTFSRPSLALPSVWESISREDRNSIIVSNFKATAIHKMQSPCCGLLRPRYSQEKPNELAI